MLNARLRTAFIALPLFLAALFYLPKTGWALFLTPWLLIGAWEWAVLAKWSLVARTCYVLILAALSLVFGMLVVAPAHVPAEITLYAIVMIFWLLVAPLWLARGWRVDHPLVLALTGIILLLPLWLALVQLQR